MLRGTMLPLALLIGFAACSGDTPTQLPSDPYERWKSLQLHSYTIDQAKACFCPNAGVPMRLYVRGDTVNALMRISDGTMFTPAQAPGYLAVDSLFGMIRYGTHDSLVVQYNKTFGYPEYLDIDPQLHPVDGGVLYTTSNLRVQ